MPIPGFSGEQLLAKFQQRTQGPQGGPAAPQAQGGFRQSPWGTRITTPQGSGGNGFPYYDLDEHGIPVPPDNMDAKQFQRYFQDLGELSPPVPANQLKGPWRDAFALADKRRQALMQNRPPLSGREARMYQSYDPE